LRRRLLLGYLTITVLTLLVLVYPLGRVFASRERDRLLRDIEHDAAVVSNLAEDALERGDRPPIDRLLAEYARDPGGRIVVLDRAGHVVVDSDPATGAGEDYSSRPEVAAALAGDRAEGSRHSGTLGHDLVYVAIPVASSGVVHGVVRITYPTSTLDARVRATWIRLGVLSAVVIIAVLGAGLVLARSVTAPVDRLKTAARRIADGDLGARAPIGHGAPELQELGHIFNDTAARLEAIVRSHEAFVADAAHQLRTPLAALRLRLENIEVDAPDELQPALAAARSETQRLGRLTEALLGLARVAGATDQPTSVDLAAIARDRHATWEPAAADAGVRLLLDGPPNAEVRALPGALEQILDNLLANALEVAPEGTTVGIGIMPGARRGTVALHVVDHGPGLDDEQRRRAFDRFWRAPTAPPGGSGIGLAIVAELATRSGGVAWLEPADGGGIDAVVQLPIAKAAHDRR
jgi:signal transduction histidine kinase